MLFSVIVNTDKVVHWVSRRRSTFAMDLGAARSPTRSQHKVFTPKNMAVSTLPTEFLMKRFLESLPVYERGTKTQTRVDDWNGAVIE